MNYDKLLAEYSSISETDFWLAFNARIAEYRAILSRECETKDDPRKSQGGLVAIDFILGRNEQPHLAQRLLAELKKKS